MYYLLKAKLCFLAKFPQLQDRKLILYRDLEKGLQPFIVKRVVMSAMELWKSVYPGELIADCVSLRNVFTGVGWQCTI